MLQIREFTYFTFSSICKVELNHFNSSSSMCRVSNHHHHHHIHNFSFKQHQTHPPLLNTPQPVHCQQHVVKNTIKTIPIPTVHPPSISKVYLSTMSILKYPQHPPILHTRTIRRRHHHPRRCPTNLKSTHRFHQPLIFLQTSPSPHRA